jgi:hypothetical protein
MVIRSQKLLPVKKELNSFALPLVLIVMIVLSLFLQEIVVFSTNRFLSNKSMIEKELLNDVISIGNKTLEKALIQNGIGDIAGSGSFRSIIKENPKLYLDMNGDGIHDSVILFSFVNVSSIKIEFALTAYRLKIPGAEETNHDWATMKMEPTSPRLINVLIDSVSTQTQVSEFIQFSLKLSNSVTVIDKVTLIKKLNLVYIPSV